MELNDNDRQRIEDFITKLGWDEKGTAEFNDMMKVAEYATKYEREQQAKEIEKLKELLRTAEGALRFAGLERTADVIEKALNE